jgi:tRNA threonylcarbamoyl adenosine modification protein (Sua5/YciO/YrdC/YwlC family)
VTELIAATAPDALERAAAALRRGEVIAIPTETVYGLAVLPQQAPLERLLAAKQRSADKGIQLLVDSIDQAAGLATLTPAAEQLARAFWPGGLTLVLERRPDVGLPLLLGGGRPTLGIRLPDHDLPRALARLLGPIAASSANVSGQPPATTAALVLATLGDVLGLVVDGGAVRGGVASTVVDCAANPAAPAILREGAIPVVEIFRALGRDYTGG